MSAAAAVLAHRVSPTARQWWLFPERGDEPCVHRAQDALGMVPVHQLGVRSGWGVAGLTALGTVRTAVAVATGGGTRAEHWPEDPDAHEAPEDPVAPDEQTVPEPGPETGPGASEESVSP